MHGPLIGGIILVPHEDFMMLENVAVRSDSSGMGVGAALIKQAEADCLELGLHQLRLSTHIDMPENVRLYELYATPIPRVFAAEQQHQDWND